MRFVNILKVASLTFLFAMIFTACESPQKGIITPNQTPSAVISGSDISFVSPDNTAESKDNQKNSSPDGSALALQDNFLGEWHRTGTLAAYYGTITIVNQTAGSFDFAFDGAYGGNTGRVNGKAIITGENTAEFTCTADYDNSVYAVVGFMLKDENLHIQLTDGSEDAPGFGHNVFIDGDYTTTHPIYTNEGIADKILPTDQMKTNMIALLGSDVYGEMLNVFQYGIPYMSTQNISNYRNGLTYSGFISGAGEGIDLMINGNKIYCLAYGLDSDGGIYKFYTNDSEYQNQLPPFMPIDRPDYILKFIYKS